MTHLRQRMIEDMQLRGLAEGCAGYLTHPLEFPADKWPTPSKTGIMPVDPKPRLESTTA